MTTWRDCIAYIMERHGGELHLSTLYKEFPDFYQGDFSNVNNMESEIRSNLQCYSSDAARFGHDDDLFYMVKNKGRGWWGLRSYSKAPSASKTRSQTVSKRELEKPKIKIRRKK